MALLTGVFAGLGLLSLTALARFSFNWLFVYLVLLSLAGFLWSLKSRGRQDGQKGKH
jgi:hypothetical protein